MSTGAEEFYVQLDHDRATMDDYFDTMNDRPLKLTPESVGYSPRPKYPETCIDCVHFFKSKVAHHNVCEVMRPRSESESVSPVGWCRFFTANYRDFPLLDKETAQ